MLNYIILSELYNFALSLFETISFHETISFDENHAMLWNTTFQNI